MLLQWILSMLKPHVNNFFNLNGEIRAGIWCMAAHRRVEYKPFAYLPAESSFVGDGFILVMKGSNFGKSFSSYPVFLDTHESMGAEWC